MGSKETMAKAKSSVMANRFKISDAMWEKIKPLIPKRVSTHPAGGHL